MIKEKDGEQKDASSGGVGGSLPRREFEDVCAGDGRAAIRRIAQPDGPSDEFAGRELLRKDIRSKKKQLIAANLKLTEAEATKFWPVYDQYTQELIGINDKKYALIKQYAENWGGITDDQAMIWVRDWLDLDTAVTQLRSKYVPLVRAVLPGKKAATFFQLDRRVSEMIDLQISSQIPLVQSQE